MDKFVRRQKFFSKRKTLLFFSCLFFCYNGSVYSQEWNVDSDGDWNTAGNWNPAVVPNNFGDIATFGLIITAPRTVTVAPNTFSVGTLNFNNSNSYLISGGTLRINGPINSQDGSHTVSSDLILDTSSDLTANAGTFTLSGAISGLNALTKLGTGTLVLSGANTYLGGTTLSAGTLQISDDTNLGDSTAPLNFEGGTLNTTTTFSSNRNMGGTQTAIIETNDATTLTLSGVISSSGGLEKQETGTLVLSGNNTYGTLTNILAGTVQVSSDANLGDIPATISIDGDAVLNFTQSFTANRDVNLDAGGGVFEVDPAVDATLGGNITGFGSLTKTGSGNLIISGGGNSYTGDTIINAGTVTISGGVPLGNGSDLIMGGGTLEIEGGGPFLESVGSLSGTGTINLNDNTLEVIQATDGEYSGTISGSGATGFIVKRGGSILTLSGVNTYTGNTEIQEGTLRIGADSALGNGTGITFINGTLNTTTTFASTKNIDVQTGATFEVDDSTTLTLSGAISGAGSLTKSSTGTLILSELNGYDGDTNVLAGTLVVADETNLGNGNITLDGGTLNTTATFSTSKLVNVNVSGGTVNTDNATELSLDGQVTGAGILTKSGAGTLTLSNGTNNYAGGTVLSSGILLVGADANLGTGGLNFDGGTLNTAATFSSGKGITLTSSGEIDTDTSTTLTLTEVITGAGTLTKSGAGGLTLTGANDYTGATTLDAGTLTLSGSGTLGNNSDLTANAGTFVIETDAGSKGIGSLSGSGNVNLNNNTLTVTQGSEGTLSGIVSGSGGLTKAGAENLILSNTNTYTGATTLDAGTLTLSGANGSISDSTSVTLNGGTFAVASGAGAKAINTVSGSGNVNVNDNTLTVTQGASATLSGVISGTGGITKEGAGTLTLSGNSSGFTGTTTINTGGLAVTGNLGGNLAVSSNGVLSGTGEVGSVTNTGTVQPGSSIGTLTIDGDFTQGADGNLEIEINPAGDSDLLDISGTATLDGTLTILPLSGSYTLGTTYTFLTAGLGVNGTFANVVESHPLNFTVSYLANSVQIMIASSANILPVPISALRGNARSAAIYLFYDDFTSSNTDLVDVLNQIASLSATQFPDALRRIGSAQFGALPLISLQSDVRIAETMVKNSKTFGYCNSCPDAIDETLKDSVWVEPIGYYYSQEAYKQDGVQDQTKFDAVTYGFNLGYTHRFMNAFNVSGGVGYTHSDIQWKKDAGKGDCETIYVSPSFVWLKNDAYLGILTLGAFNFYDIERVIIFPGFKRTAKNDHKSYDLLVRADAGIKYNFTKCFIQPQFSLSYLNIFEDGYSESDADSLNLKIDPKYNAFLRPQAKLKIGQEVCRGNLCVAPSMSVGWVSNIPLTNSDYTASLKSVVLPNPNFKSQSFHKVTNQLSIGTEFLVKSTDFLVSIGYEANFLNQNQVQEGKVRFEWNF